MNVTVVSNLGQKIVQRFQCKGCMRCFGNTSGLTRHSAHCNNSSIENILSTASIRFECSRCKKSFSSKGYLKQHLLNSKYCKRLAEDSIALALSETNSSTASLTCNGCNKEFTQRNGLTNHRKFCHELTSKESSGSRVEESEVAEISLTNPLLCMKCNKVFKNKGGLTTHRKYCKGNDKAEKSANQELVNKVAENSVNKDAEKSANVDAEKTPNLESDESTSQEAEKSATREAEKSASREAEKSASKEAEKSASQEAEKSACKEAEKSAGKEAERAVCHEADKSALSERVSSQTQDLACPFCPKICKNRGSLASHKKACEIKKNPNLLKTRRRLSRSLNIGRALSVQEKDRRLSTTLLVQEVIK